MAAQADKVPDHRVIHTGDKPGQGRYRCRVCGTRIDVNSYEPLPRCPFCHGDEFSRVHN